MRPCEFFAYIQLLATIGTTLCTPIFDHKDEDREKRALANKSCSELKATEWSSWGPCYSVMGMYIQSRWRTRVESFPYKGPKCPKQWDERICEPYDLNNVRGRDVDRDRRRCDLTEWSNWSECYFYVRSMERERHRSPYFSSNGRMKCSEVRASILVQYEECQNDCTWTSWSSCFQYGTTKNPKWERYRENKSESHSYMLCPGRWAEFQGCEFCEWSTWKHWSSCFEFASNYERKRERSRVLSNSRRGIKCTEMDSHDAEEYGPCPTEDEDSSSNFIEPTQSARLHGQPEMYTPAATYSFVGNT